nr:hypothetical protein B7L51_01445 [Pectobacterium carotovorum]
MCWLRSVTQITYLSKLIGMPSLAACLQLELFRVDTRALSLFFNTVFSYQYGWSCCMAMR